MVEHQEPIDFVAKASDFECLQNWPKVRNIRITNKLDFQLEAIALAEDPQPGKQYPVGTIIQLFPGEAMVKRGADFDPQNNNWEYFQLIVSEEGTEINVRGNDAVSMFGGECVDCHKAAQAFDFVCETGRGCIELPIGPGLIEFLQKNDPRCT